VEFLRKTPHFHQYHSFLTLSRLQHIYSLLLKNPSKYSPLLYFLVHTFSTHSLKWPQYLDSPASSPRPIHSNLQQLIHMQLPRVLTRPKCKAYLLHSTTCHNISHNIIIHSCRTWQIWPSPIQQWSANCSTHHLPSWDNRHTPGWNSQKYLDQIWWWFEGLYKFSSRLDEPKATLQCCSSNHQKCLLAAML